MSIFKKYWMYLLPLLTLLLGIGVGFFAKPAKVTEKEKIVYQDREVTKTVEVEKKVDTKNTDLDQKKATHTVEVAVTKPDGSKTVTTTTDENLNTQVKEVEIQYVDRVKEVEVTKEVIKTVEVEKTTENQANWHAAFLIGTSTQNFSITPTAPWVNPLILGLDVDRRVLGPVSLGLWVQTTSKFNSIAGGLSVGASW